MPSQSAQLNVLRNSMSNHVKGNVINGLIHSYILRSGIGIYNKIYDFITFNPNFPVGGLNKIFTYVLFIIL